MSNLLPETRNRILQATIATLESADGKAVRISDIARGAGLTRQTLHLYFSTRSELLIAATHHLDELHSSDEMLSKSRNAKTGMERLEAFVEAWAGYIPNIYGVARALLIMNDQDSREAWTTRMQDMWEGCEAAISALNKDNRLNPEYSVKEASDLLWTLLSIHNWVHLTVDRGWSEDAYLDHVQRMAKTLFVRQNG